LQPGKVAEAENLWDRFPILKNGGEPADLRRKDLDCRRSGGGSRASSSAIGVVALLAVVCTVRAASAQDAWNFSSEIPCATAPVYGVQFNQCWVSNVRSFRVGNVQSWRLTYVDPKSEFAIGLYRLVEAHGVGGMSPVPPNASMIEWIRTADALKNITTGGTAWNLSASDTGERYVTFQKAQRQCIGFVRNGPAQNWTLGAAFCRESATPIPTAEAQFIADTVRVRD
jgi:hypothetical protein